jgi:SAM-dependent methyltransferase
MAQPAVVTANEEAIEAWNGVLFDRFLKHRAQVVEALGAHGARAIDENPPAAGERVLDIGCGFGETTARLAGLAGPEGSAHGVDAAPRFVEHATAEARQAGVENVSYAVADVEAAPVDGGPFDLAFSQMGTMFFANPVAAMRNVRAVVRPGGRLCMVVWRQKAENEWLFRSEQVVDRYLEEPEETDEPTCGPGPFSMANADTTSGILRSAGWEGIALRRSDIDVRIGRTLQDAIDLTMAIGPAAEVIRLAGDDAAKIRPRLEREIGEVLGEFETPEGIRTHSSTWIVTAVAP